jgi:TPR repeat protein
MTATTPSLRPLVCGALALGLAAGQAGAAEKKAFAQPAPPTPAVAAPLSAPSANVRVGDADATNRPRVVDADDKYAAALKKWAGPAAKGDAVAQLRLGRVYRRGKDTHANTQRALRWLRAAARSNLAAAHYQLGLLYMAGIDGKDPDLVEAYARFKIASEGGDVRATALVFYIGVRMTADELRQAHERIADIHRFEIGPAAPPVETDTAADSAPAAKTAHAKSDAARSADAQPVKPAAAPAK